MRKKQEDKPSAKTGPLRLASASAARRRLVPAFFRLPILPSLALLLLVLAPGSCAGNAPAPKIYSESRVALGPVLVEVRVVASSETQGKRAIERAFAAVKEVNDRLNLYSADSELSRLNKSAGREFTVSEQMSEVLRSALEVADMTDGTFDVTCGPLVRIWKGVINNVHALRDATGDLEDALAPISPIDAALIHVAEQSAEPAFLPTPEAVAAARAKVGCKNLVLGPHSVTLKLDGMSVDLGGIAKGYAIDQAVKAIKAEGVTAALINACGDGYALGSKPDGSPWRVGIQNPRGEQGERLEDILLLSDMAYSTSGDYEQYVDIAGTRYAHVIDPRTGQPARLACSVTTIAPIAAIADGLATGLSVLGPKDGIEAVRRLKGVECMIISQEGDELAIRTSPGFNRHTARVPVKK